MPKRTIDAAEPIDMLRWLNKHPQCEVSYDHWDAERWQVHRVTGGRNDRKWWLIGEGETVEDAILAAMASATAAAPKPRKPGDA